MTTGSLPLTRRGLSLCRWGLILGLAILPLQFLPMAASAEKLNWLLLFAQAWLGTASLLIVVVGVFLTTAAPGPSPATGWELSFLALTAISKLWPVAVYVAELPHAFRSLLSPLAAVTLVLQFLLLFGLFAALGRSLATQASAGGAMWAAAPLWESLASQGKKLFSQALVCAIPWLLILAVGIAGVVGFPMVGPGGLLIGLLVAVAIGSAWGVWLLIRSIGLLAAMERALGPGPDSGRMTSAPTGLRSLTLFSAPALLAAALALLGVGANTWVGRTLATVYKPGIGSETVGTAAPTMEMHSIDGATLQLADFQGKVVVLNFWATWCGPCVAEIPDLVRLATEIEREGGVVIGISSEEPDAVRAFVAAQKIPYQMMTGSFWPPPFDRINSVPTTFIIDASGRIRKTMVGKRSYAEFRRAFDAVKSAAVVPLPAEALPAEPAATVDRSAEAEALPRK